MFVRRVDRILAYGEPIDMRKSFDGLLGMVRAFDALLTTNQVLTTKVKEL